MNWTVADYLQASNVCLTGLSIIVTTFMAWWVVKSVQHKLDTEKTLKEHFAHEVISLRRETRDFIAKVISGGLKAKDIKFNYNHLRVHISDLQIILCRKYNINMTFLKAYKLNMIKIIEKDSSFENAYMDNLPVFICSKTAHDLYKIEQDNDHIFNEILLKIYDTVN